MRTRTHASTRTAAYLHVQQLSKCADAHDLRYVADEGEHAITFQEYTTQIDDVGLVSRASTVGLSTDQLLQRMQLSRVMKETPSEAELVCVYRHGICRDMACKWLAAAVVVYLDHTRAVQVAFVLGAMGILATLVVICCRSSCCGANGHKQSADLV